MILGAHHYAKYVSSNYSVVVKTETGWQTVAFNHSHEREKYITEVLSMGNRPYKRLAPKHCGVNF